MEPTDDTYTDQFYVLTGGIVVPYCVPYSYKLNFDDSRKGVAKVDRVVHVGLRVHCKGEWNLQKRGKQVNIERCRGAHLLSVVLWQQPDLEQHSCAELIGMCFISGDANTYQQVPFTMF